MLISLSKKKKKTSSISNIFNAKKKLSLQQVSSKKEQKANN